LRGRIDRIDRRKPHEYEVWDYKTGSSWGYSEEGHLNSGKQLQHCLYALAAEILLQKGPDKNARVVRGGYFFMSPKGEGLRIEKSQVSREALFELLKDLFEILRSGTFPCSFDKEPCRFCDYSAVCGGEEIAVPRAKEKLSTDEKLKAVGRLKDYA
jgi:RecB family exonuclease